jgi:hypothetical protein
MVLLNPQPEVEEALKAVGIDQGVPIVHSVEDGVKLRPTRCAVVTPFQLLCPSAPAAQ